VEHAGPGAGHGARGPAARRVARRPLQARLSQARRREVPEDDAGPLRRRDQRAADQLRAGRHVADRAARAQVRHREGGREAGGGDGCEENGMSKVRLKIKRQTDRDAAPRWEEFDVEREPQLNIIAALMQIRRNPTTASGQATTPVAWDSNCLEEGCGDCTVLVNGRVRRACSTLVDRLPAGPITLEPMSKFPVVRDLIVDRSRLFDSLKRVHAWIQLDGSYDLGPGPRYSEDQWHDRYALSRCFS